jgi:hypothetical protein
VKFLAVLADRILSRVAPLPETNRAHWLAVAEQSRDAWEKFELPADCPKCFPDGWELQVHDAVYEDDELWAAAQRKDSAPFTPGGAAPADADIPPSASAGIPTVGRVITQTLRTLQVPNAVVIKDALERELSHHFEFRSK